MVKILVCDDNKDIRFAIKDGLEELNKGYEIIEADGGEAALQLLKTERPDVIFMDIMMPGLDGFDTSIKIKEIPECKDIPIIFLSAKTDNVSKGAAGVFGDIFIEKPAKIEEIDNLLQKVLKK